MAIDKEQFEDLCASYALGVLDRNEEFLLLDTLRQGDPELRKIFSEHLGVIDLLNRSLITKTPSPKVRQRLMRRITSGSEPLSPAGRALENISIALGFGNPRYGLAIALLLVIVIGEIAGYAYLLYDGTRHFEQRIAHFESQLAEQQQRFASLQSGYELQREMTNVLQSRTIAVAVMNGLDVNPSGYGKIIWDPVRKIAILHISGLPAAPAGKEYQLWYLNTEKVPVSAGLFAVNKTNENFFKVASIPVPDNTNEITAFAVTVEPKGGVPQPTGTMYLMGIPAHH